MTQYISSETDLQSRIQKKKKIKKKYYRALTWTLKI